MTVVPRPLALPLIGRRAGHVVERDVLNFRRTWIILVSGFFEPLFYLLGLGFGLGRLIGDVDGVPYAVFVAPALLATSAMNGAIYDSTFNFFYKLKHAHTYDAMLATPMTVPDVAVGEVTWALMRGALYALAFVVVMLLLGLLTSPWALLAAPAAVLIAFAAAGLGSAATSYVRRWEDFELVFVVTLPLFLFSGTFFPVTVYPEPLRTLVELSPLYRGVHLLRGLTTGAIEPMLLVDALYMVVIGAIGLAITTRRLGRLLQR